jgi:bacillithiol synthase
MTAANYNASYLSRSMIADEFLPAGYGSLSDRLARPKLLAQRQVDPRVLRVLREQNALLAQTPARQRHLEALSQSGTTVVITGQQVGVFLGPLYTIYKAATAVKAAQQFERETGQPCVPIFWLQTEDHDFEEIAAAHTWFSKGSPLASSVTATQPPRSSVVQAVIDEGFGNELATLENSLAELPHGAEVMALLRLAYVPGRPLWQAFALVLGALFAKEGLLVFHPREAPIASLAAPLIQKCLVSSQQIEDLLVERETQLLAKGFQSQVQLRRDSPLAFLHQGSSRGPRYRLERKRDDLCLPAETKEPPQSLADVLEVLERDPLRFSTSALLRPLLQDTLFPTAGYVGGPAEISYFTQLLPLYDFFELPPPMLIPRARFRLVPKTIRRALEALKLTASQAERPLESLLSAHVATLAPLELMPGGHWLSEFRERLASFSQATHGDPKLARAAERTAISTERNVRRFEARVKHLALTRESVAGERVRKISECLFPQGAPQERHWSFVGFAAEMGLSAFIESILEATQPLDPVVRELSV